MQIIDISDLSDFDCIGLIDKMINNINTNKIIYPFNDFMNFHLIVTLFLIL